MSSTTTTNESEDGMLSKDQTNSSSLEDGNSRGVGCGTVLKKGPWTSAEDAILIDYVRKHGEGNWNSVQKHSGLSRCGKSCRLRWANHLRPNLKKGAFTTEEEHLIVELHAKLGNKWARMAAYLPGRTDNEIKNYWNTRIKRRQRAGLPLYPPDVCLKAMNEGQHNQNIGELNTGETRHNDLLSASSYDIPDVIFDNLRANPGAVSYASHLPNISVSGMLGQGLSSSQSFNFIPSTMHHIKRPRESETLIPGFSGSFINGHTPFGPFQSDSFGKIHRPFGLGLPYDPDPDINNPAPFAGVMTGSRALSNGNFSTSKSLAGTVKQELPSLQFPETDFGGWDTFPPTTPSLEPADAYTQSPLSSTVQMQSECLSYWDTGLPQAVFHESQAVGSAKSQSAEKSSNSTTVTPTDMMDGSTLNLSEVEWDGYGDPISPLGQSVASVFSACTPPISSCSLEESAPSKALPGLEAKTQQSVEHVSTPEGGDKVTHLEYVRPDALLGGNFFTESNDYDKALAAFVNEDYSLSDDYKHPTTAGTSVNQEDMGLGLYPWCNTSLLHQMSQLPF